jgi:hypothetical protein
VHGLLLPQPDEAVLAVLLVEVEREEARLLVGDADRCIPGGADLLLDLIRVEGVHPAGACVATRHRAFLVPLAAALDPRADEGRQTQLGVVQPGGQERVGGVVGVHWRTSGSPGTLQSAANCSSTRSWAYSGSTPARWRHPYTTPRGLSGHVEAGGQPPSRRVRSRGVFRKGGGLLGRDLPDRRTAPGVQDLLEGIGQQAAGHGAPAGPEHCDRVLGDELGQPAAVFSAHRGDLLTELLERRECGRGVPAWCACEGRAPTRAVVVWMSFARPRVCPRRRAVLQSRS